MKGVRSLSFDAKKVVEGKFKPSKAAEKQFQSALRKVARVSGHLVDQHVEGSTIKNTAEMRRSLEEYSKAIGPWAQRQSLKLLNAVQKSNKRAYERSSKAIGKALEIGAGEAQSQAVAYALMNEQIALIKSIPIEAGERAQQLAREAYMTGTRADEISKELQRTTGVTESRANLIAVTETARANASFTQARATAVGAVGYIWRATMDGATRPSHARMNGKYVPYDKPPHLIDGTTGHAGTFPRCRCYQEPVFED